MQQMSWGIGLMPEQVWEDPDIPAAPYGSNPATASIGFIDGKAAGSATPLIWAEGQYVRLVRDLGAGNLLDQPAITRARYVTGGPPATVPLTIKVTAPGAVPAAAEHVDGGPGRHRGRPGQPGAGPDHQAGPGHGDRDDGTWRGRRRRGQPAGRRGQHDRGHPGRGRLRGSFRAVVARPCPASPS